MPWFRKVQDGEESGWDYKEERIWRAGAAAGTVGRKK